MATYDYEKTKQQYESLSDQKKQEFANMKWWYVQDFLTRYNAEKSSASTPTSTTTTTKTSTATAVPEYQWSGNTASKQNTYTNQWEGTYSYNPQTQYYEKQWTTQNDTYAQIRSEWDKLTYDQQQAKLKENPNLKAWVEKVWWTFKTKPEETTTTPETPTEETPKQWEWDYQDNSPERMKQMSDNVNKIYQTDPYIFNSEDSFRKFFIDWKGRTPEQEAFLMDLYKNRKKYNELDNYTADQIWYMDTHWELPESYLTYLKNSDPERYAAVMDAKAAETDKIKDASTLGTIWAMTWESEDTTTSKAIEWLKSQWLFLDKDWNLIDDRTENYASEEEKTYLKALSDLAARNLEIDNTVKHTYDDLVDKYPWATKATLMAMAQDINSDLLREKENNNVEMARYQWYVNYMQSERQEKDKVWQNAINQLKNSLADYYKYSPEWLSEYAQYQYAATNVTLDQADKWTDAQKQMALESVLTPIYEQFWSIIQRSKAQVINDVIAYANNKWITLSQALEENFMTPLKNKDTYKLYQSSLTRWLWDWNWTLEPIKDAKWNITWYVRINKTTWEIVPYTWTAWAWTAWWTYNETTWVYNYEESWMKWAWLKNNNPWNITDSNVWEIWRNGKFAVFETPEDWFDALVQKIQNAQNWLSKNYPATATLYQFFSKYAPSSDNNNPKAYAESVASQLWVSPNAQIKDLDTIQFAAAIAKHDSWYNYSTYWMFRWWQWVTWLDYYWRSPMDTKFEDAISNASTQSAKDALAYASTVYSNLYEIAADWSLDEFIQSWDFQKIMSNLNVSKALTWDTQRWQSFFNEFVRAIEKSNIVDPNSQRVMNILKNMVEQKLRDESWAAISSSEWLSNFQWYLPQAWEIKDVSLSKMQQWEKNVILKTLVWAWMSKSDYEWLFAPNSKYYKTVEWWKMYDKAVSWKNGKWTFDIWVWSVVQSPSGWEYDSLFTILWY